VYGAPYQPFIGIPAATAPFTPASSTFGVGPILYFVAFGDFNGDGILDVANGEWWK